MLRIEKINKAISLRIDYKNVLLSSLFVKAFIASIALHALLFFIFSITSKPVEEGILLMPTAVDADSSSFEYLSSTSTTGISNNSLSELLRPIEKLSNAHPKTLTSKIELRKHIPCINTELPAFKILEDKLTQDDNLSFLSTLMTVTIYPKDSIKLKNRTKSKLLEKIQKPQEAFASFKVLVDAQTGKVVDFKELSNEVNKNEINFNEFMNDLLFEIKSTLNSIVELEIEFNMLKSQEINSRIIFK